MRTSLRAIRPGTEYQQSQPQSLPCGSTQSTSGPSVSHGIQWPPPLSTREVWELCEKIPCVELKPVAFTLWLPKNRESKNEKKFPCVFPWLTCDQKQFLTVNTLALAIWVQSRGRWWSQFKLFPTSFCLNVSYTVVNSNLSIISMISIIPSKWGNL